MTDRIMRRLSTTEGRQRLPDLIQSVYGEKSIVIFHRYGRELAALIPLDMLPRAVLERAALICEQQARDFLSPEYAADQPLSSIGERFACGECAKAIREAK